MIVFDLLGVQNRDHGERGIARYVLSLAVAIEKDYPGFVDAYLVHPHLPVPNSLRPLIETGRAVRTDSFRPPKNGGFFLCGSMVELQEPDHIVLPPWARRPEWTVGTILYDLIPLLYPERYLSNSHVAFRLRARTQLLATSNHLFAISDTSASDATSILGIPPGRITSIGAGTGAEFSLPSLIPEQIASELIASGTIEGLRDKFILFPTGIEPRKNNDRMLEAYAKLPKETRDRHQLALVCRTTEQDHIALDKQAKQLGIKGQLLVTGFVSDADLVSLYQSAELVVFPSEYEGFGLPVLEARRCGAAVICSDSSSLREVQPDPSARFDPLSVSSIAECLENSLTKDNELERLRNLPVPEFTWANSARLTVSAIEQVLSTKVTREKPRLALVSPVAPERSGIADYSSALACELAKACELVVYTDAEPNSALPIDGVAIRKASELLVDERLDGSFHEVIYQLGNSEFHIGALTMLRQRPGIVEFHDARLTGLYHQMFETDRSLLPGGTVGSALEHWYPHRYRRSLEEMAVVWPEVAERFGVLMAREAANLATEIWTHSSYASTLIELDTGREADWIFPLAMSPVQPTRTASQSTIASFGLVAKVKQYDLLLRAFSLGLRAMPEAQLRIVGGTDSSSRDWLANVPTSKEAQRRTTYTGHLDRVQWDLEVKQSTLAVQLRASSNGESSGAIANLLSAGVPVVATGIGANLELPGDSVVLVQPDITPEALAGVLIDLMNDPERLLSMSESARRYAAKNSYSETAKRMLGRLQLV